MSKLFLEDNNMIKIVCNSNVKNVKLTEAITFDMFLKYLEKKENSKVRQYWKLRKNGFWSLEKKELEVYTFKGNIYSGMLKAIKVAETIACIGGWKNLKEDFERNISRLIKEFFEYNEDVTLENLQEYIFEIVVLVNVDNEFGSFDSIYLEKVTKPILM